MKPCRSIAGCQYVFSWKIHHLLGLSRISLRHSERCQPLCRRIGRQTGRSCTRTTSIGTSRPSARSGTLRTRSSASLLLAGAHAATRFTVKTAYLRCQARMLRDHWRYPTAWIGETTPIDSIPSLTD